MSNLNYLPEGLTHKERALKIAIDEAVAACGGQEPVALEIGVHQTRVSHWKNPSFDKKKGGFPMINYALHMDLLAGAPHITAKMAALQNYGLYRLPKGRTTAATLKTVGKISKEHGEMMQGLLVAVSDDGEVNAHEIMKHNLIEEVDELIAVLVGCRQQLIETLEAEG